MEFSFIDFGNRDFLRNDDGTLIVITFADASEADTWMMDNYSRLDVSGEGVRIHCWDE